MSKKQILIFTFLLFVGTLAANAQTCDPSLWSHIYAGDHRRFQTPQDRLQVIQDCVTVTGTFIHAKKEKDGDYHITIKIDAEFASMLNSVNIKRQHGYLVVEPICQNPVTQSDALKAGVCLNFHQTFKMPKKGTRVSVTGVFVTDMEHGWREAHPVTSFEVIR